MEDEAPLAADTPSEPPFTQLVIETFRLNGRLLAAGDRLTRDLGLSSARWQVLGAIDRGPMTVAGIARVMGLRRQSVQRTVDVLAGDGLVRLAGNPHHRRANLVTLTAAGRSVLDEATRRQRLWAERIAGPVPATALEAALTVVRALRSRLEAEDGTAPGENDDIMEGEPE